MNKRHQYRDMEREYVTSDISIRALCRKHDISAHSLVTVQAKKHKSAEKREAYQAKESEAFMSRDAARQADRLAEIHDKTIDVIDAAIDKFREDMRATEQKLVNGEWVEVAAWYITPRDLCLLIDRFEVLFGRPSVISQHQGLMVSTELSPDALREFIEAIRGRSAPPTSPLPRTRRLDD